MTRISFFDSGAPVTRDQQIDDLARCQAELREMEANRNVWKARAIDLLSELIEARIARITSNWDREP